MAGRRRAAAAGAFAFRAAFPSLSAPQGAARYVNDGRADAAVPVQGAAPAGVGHVVVGFGRAKVGGARAAMTVSLGFVQRACAFGGRPLARVVASIACIRASCPEGRLRLSNIALKAYRILSQMRTQLCQGPCSM